MKTFRKMIMTGLIGAVIVSSAGCANDKPEMQSSDMVASETGSKMNVPEETTEAKASHQVSVEDLSKTTLSDDTTEYVSTCPKLIIDGVEATEINSYVSEYIQNNYPMEKSEDEYGYVDGYETRYAWGVKDNVVSIVIRANYISEDYGTCEVFNFDLETRKALEDGEVLKCFGMTDDELFEKTADIYRKYCSDGTTFDLDKSIASVNYDEITPFVTPDGNLGVAGSIYYSADSQFAGMATVRCFDVETMDLTNF